MQFEINSSSRDVLKFNEITALAGVKPYVLRFWESEFDQITPTLGEGGQKIYTQLDLDAILKIKELLFEEKLSIPQAKSFMDEEALKLQSSHADDQFEDGEENNSAYKSVETQLSTFDRVKSALANDLEQNKPTPSMNAKVYQDVDIVNLIQAKKKLASALKLIHQLSHSRNW